MQENLYAKISCFLNSISYFLLLISYILPLIEEREGHLRGRGKIKPNKADIPSPPTVSLSRSPIPFPLSFGGFALVL